ncbi:U32 family peptidase [Candidatus Poribacteria bacterium]|nr:U32 family peptidase [Candidatus Poribacteria bacterium]
MQIAITAYTLDDLLFIKDSSAHIIRFGEPDCFSRAMKNWPVENISRAIEILRKANKISQFQFLHSPVSREEINYLNKVSRTFPDLDIVIETYGFLNSIKNKKIAGQGIKAYNIQSLEILEKSKCSIISLPFEFSPVDVLNLKQIIETNKYSIELEYCFFGRERLLSSWQCFLRRFASQPQSTDMECTNICNQQELTMTDANNEQINFSIMGNTIFTSSHKNKIDRLQEYINAGIAYALLDFRIGDREIITNIL